MDISLIPIPNTAEEEHVIHQGHGLVGRGTDCDLKLNHATVSRHHAEFRVDDGTLYLRDLRSRNGTFANGKQIHRDHELHDGDVVSFGMQSFEVRCRQLMCAS